MEKQVVISVVMCIYNESICLIREAIDSILNQSYTNFELIVIVDNPNIESIIKSYLDKLENGNTKVRILYNEKNIGLALSLNRGIKVANGTIIARMDSDDISFSERLDEEYKVMLKENADLVFSGKIDIDENGIINETYYDVPTSDASIKKILRYSNCINHPTVLVKKNVLEKVGYYYNFRQSQDYDLWLRIKNAGYVMAGINKPLVYYRVRKASISNSKAYLQYLTKEFQRKNCWNEKDYTKKLEEFLMKNGGFDINKNNKFDTSLRLYNMSVEKIKDKRISGFIYLIRAILKNKQIVNILISSIVYRREIKKSNYLIEEVER